MEESATELLSQLNDEQRAAVVWCDGPSLVIAGAGSGKTRVLTYKIAWLLQQGMQPWQILALTFTNKAAREMKTRIAQLVGESKAYALQMGTFHSVFARILRAEAHLIGFNSNFTIYDQTDARSLVKAIIKEMGLDDTVYKYTSVADRISMAKNHLVTPQQYSASPWAQEDIRQRRPDVSNIYIRYAARCQQANAMDFDDLLLHTHELFTHHDDVRRKYAERYQFVLVDEYQDTNRAQQAIVLQLTKERQRVCAVGDDAQSIYSFRGANIDNILNFQSFYQGTRLFKLQQNYRSTQMIVRAANSLIRKNERQIPKDIYSKNEQGGKVTFKATYSDKEEAAVVAKDIRRLRHDDHCGWADFAILYRTNAQSRSFEEQLSKDGIPYRIYGGLSFYQRKEIKDIIAYYRLVANPDDEEAFKRIVNYPTRGIGQTTLDIIVTTATREGASLWRVIAEPEQYPAGLSKGTLAKLQAFKSLVESWRQRLLTDDAYTLGHAIIFESGISQDIIGSNSPEDIARKENVEEFLGALQSFVVGRREEGLGDHTLLTDYLQEVALLTDLDSDDSSDPDKVSLMTVHAAKGLEYPVVFVVGLEENIFPSPMCAGSMRGIEEERRLLYVAITRAKRRCFLTCAKNRFRYGRMESAPPSRFIKDIDPALITYGDASPTPYPTNRGRDWMQNPHPVADRFMADPKPRAVPPRKEERPADPFSDNFRQMLNNAATRRLKPISQRPTPVQHPSPNTYGLHEGSTIEHERFGIGTVIKVEGNGENQKATVQFRATGVKQLLLKFAKIKVLD